MNSTLSARSFLGELSVLGEPIRCRILLALEGQELSVSELCSVLQLPQSTVSRHLKTLSRDDWVRARKDGTSRRYTAPGRNGASSAELWSLVRREVSATPTALQDRRRLAATLARRSKRSREFFSSAAAEWSALRRELFGARFDLEALLALLDANWVVADLGAGTGEIASSLAPWVDRVIGVDDSAAMLEAAAGQLSSLDNVELRQGRLEELPIDDGSLDAALLVLVLHHLAEPVRVLVEAARTLKPGGKLLVVDMLPHGREEYQREMGHVWLGFEGDQLGAWLEEAGLCEWRMRELAIDPAAEGPALFSLTARKPAASGRLRRPTETKTRH